MWVTVIVRPLSVLAWPFRRGRNPYTGLLYEAILRESADRTRPSTPVMSDGAAHDDMSGRRIDDAPAAVTVEEFRVHRGWRPSCDLVHVHWPELAVESPSTAKAVAKTVVVLLDLIVQRARGARVVWTCHNLHSHDGRHPVLERLLRAVLHRLLDGVLHLGEDSVRQLLRTAPALRRVPHAVVPHGHYGPLYPDPPDRAEARRRTGVDDDATVLSFVGALRAHKDVAGLVAAFGEVADPDARLVVAGAAADETLEREVRTASTRDERVTARLTWMDDDELVATVRASDAVVLPYREFHNSGVVVLALTLGRPVVVPRTPMTEEMAGLVGEEWVHLVEGAIDPDAVRAALQVARAARDGTPDLTALDWEVVARDTIAFYRRVLARTGTPS